MNRETKVIIKLIIVLFIFAFYLIKSESHLTAGETYFLGECNINTPLYNRFPEDEGKALMDYRTAICKRVRNKSWSLEHGNRVLADYVTYYIKCNKYRLDITEKFRLENRFNNMKLNEISKKLPKQLIFAEEEFCRFLYNPNKWPFVSSKLLRERYQWLDTEYFCLLAYHIAHPGSFMEKLFEPDLPSIKRLKTKADELCDKLKRGKISKSDAYYYYRQELTRYMNDLGPEATKHYAKKIKAPLEAMWNLIKKIPE